MAPAYDADFYDAIKHLIPLIASSPKPATHDVKGRRDAVEAMYGAFMGNLPKAEGFSQSVHYTKSIDGHDVPIYRLVKDGTATTSMGPALIHAHGGGMIMGNVAAQVTHIAQYATKTGVQVFSVDYRLAPESKYPLPVEDVYATLIWLQKNAQEFNVDPARIGIVGESAGGGLAASVAIMARDRGLSPPLAKQLLLSPMLDDRNTTPIAALEPYNSMWSTEDNITGWTALLGDKAGGNDVSPYAAPARVESVKGLAPLYIEVGGLDIFRDETIKYAARFAAEDIDLELHVYRGVPHAWELLAPYARITKTSSDNRRTAMTTF
jgi:acetyl esterase/lipase